MEPCRTAPSTRSRARTCSERYGQALLDSAAIANDLEKYDESLRDASRAVALLEQAVTVLDASDAGWAKDRAAAHALLGR